MVFMKAGAHMFHKRQFCYIHVKEPQHFLKISIWNLNEPMWKRGDPVCQYVQFVQEQKAFKVSLLDFSISVQLLSNQSLC